MPVAKVTEDICAIGASDRDGKKLFERLFPIPEGVAYNSYLILDEKTAVLDGAAKEVEDEYFVNLESALNGRTLDYIVLNHLEPDHGAAIGRLIKTYPEAALVGNAKTKTILESYVGAEKVENMIIVGEGEELKLGRHSLKFIMTPMVHWPESMMCYDATDKILFSQDAFGAFGAEEDIFDDKDFDEERLEKMRRYYANIVGKYGAQVCAVLKKASALDIKTICPIHGLVLRKHIGKVLRLYTLWSGYQPEEKGVVVAYASMYGHTAALAKEACEKLNEKGVKTVLFDVSETDTSYLVSNVFRFSNVLALSVTYNANIYPKMEYFLNDLKALNVQNRAFSFVESGSWAISSGKLMREKAESLKNCRFVGDIVTLKAASYDKAAFNKLIEDIAADVKA